MRRDPFDNPQALIRRVYAYVAYRVGDGPDAEDITSEAFERALRYRASFDESRGEPLAWLLGIARRCMDDAWGRRSLQAASERTEVAGSQDLDLEAEAVQRLTLADAIARLDDRSRDLLALRYGADLSARQIGRIVGLKTNAVEVALHRAVARLRADMGKDEETRALPVRDAAPRLLP
jgi:RNA polymerase sigma-70 factor (ECF subfamily)